MPNNQSEAERALQQKYARLKALQQKKEHVEPPAPIPTHAPPQPETHSRLSGKVDARQAALEAIRAKRQAAHTPTDKKAPVKPIIKLKLANKDTLVSDKKEAIHNNKQGDGNGVVDNTAKNINIAKPIATINTVTNIHKKEQEASAAAKAKLKSLLELKKAKNTSSTTPANTTTNINTTSTISTTNNTTTNTTNTTKRTIHKRPTIKRPPPRPEPQQDTTNTNNTTLDPSSANYHHQLTTPMLFIGNLPSYFTADMLYDFFTQQFNANVMDVNVVDEYCYGFITFSSFPEAESILSFHEQQPIVLNEYDPHSAVALSWAKPMVDDHHQYQHHGDGDDYTGGGDLHGHGGEGESGHGGEEEAVHPRVKKARSAAMQVAHQVMEEYASDGVGSGRDEDDGVRALVSYDDL